MAKEPRRTRKVKDVSPARPRETSSSIHVDFSSYGLFVVIFGASFVAYLPALRGGFLWDDGAVRDNALLLDAQGLWKIWFNPLSNFREEHYWPLVYTTFWFERKLWGINPAGYHFVNVLLHSANACLLFALLGRLRIRGALFSAMVFALHPVHVEAVAWIIERKDLLCLFFLLLSFHAALSAVSKRSVALHLVTAFLFLCALFSKSVAVTFPIVLAVVLVWRVWQWNFRRAAIVFPLILIALIYVAGDLILVSKHEGFPSGLGFFQRVILAMRNLAFYTGKAILPSNLMAMYPKSDLSGINALDALIVMAFAGIAAAVWFWRRSWGAGLGVAIFVYVLTLSPMLGFIDFGFMRYAYSADRFQYVASIAPLALLGSAASMCSERLRVKSGLSWAMGMVALVPLGVMTFAESQKYRDLETLFAPNLKLNPKAWAAATNLGVHYIDTGRDAEAISFLENAIAVNPKFNKAHYNLGLAKIHLRQFEEALASLDRAIALLPKDAPSHFNRGIALNELGQLEDANAAFMQSLALGYEPTEVHHAVGVVRMRQKRFSEAEASFKKSLELGYPRPDESMNNIGVALMNQNRNTEAAEYIERALAINPRTPHAQENLARIRSISTP